MATQTPEKTNGAPVIQKTAPAVRSLGRFARDPFWALEAMRDMMESMFGLAGLPEWRGEMEPAVNLYETDGAYTLECAVPGYSKDEITVETRGDRVIISGSYDHEKTDEKKHFTHKEIRQGSTKNSAQVSRMLKRLRIHGMIKKVGRTYHYYLTRLGRTVAIAGTKLKELVLIPQLAASLG